MVMSLCGVVKWVVVMSVVRYILRLILRNIGNFYIWFFVVDEDIVVMRILKMIKELKVIIDGIWIVWCLEYYRLVKIVDVVYVMKVM